MGVGSLSEEGSWGLCGGWMTGKILGYILTQLFLSVASEFFNVTDSSQVLRGHLK
jgi:hypothetical protein